MLNFSSLWRRVKRSKSPPGPPWLEMLDELKNLKMLEFLAFRATAMMRSYGGIIRIAKHRYIIADPNAFKYILKTNPTNFTKKNRTYRRIKLIFGDGLIVNEGPVWEYHRTLLQPIFDRKRLEQYATIMVNSTQELLNSWQKNPPATLEIGKEMAVLALKIAFRAFCNYEPSFKDLEKVIRLFHVGNPHISYFPFLNPWIPSINNLRFFGSIRSLNTLLNSIIHQRKSSGSTPEDSIDILLNAKQTHGIALSEQEILDEVKTLLITGHETTGCGLGWAWYLLAKHPEYQALMEQELAVVLGGRSPTLEDCVKLPITKAIFLEALRLYPTIWCLPRRVLKNDILCDYDIKAESQLILNIYALHRNPYYWKHPEIFYPPRFLGDEDAKRHPYAYLPFSVGPHACIGAHFATTEGILLLATIGQRYRFELIKKNKDFKPEPYISLKPPARLKMRPVLCG